MSQLHTNYDSIAQSIITRVGKEVVIGIALGIGKPVGIINALYRLALADKSISLTIITALTLSRPTFRTDLEKRFAEPLLKRLLKNYEDPLYEIARLKQQLPENVRVIEFFLAPAKYLHNNYVQENYISSAYTHVVRDANRFQMNVVAQQVSHSKEDTNLYSLSCNSDLYVDMMQCIKKSGRKIAVVAEVNNNLPFMYGDAILHSEVFTDIVDTGDYHALFPLPRDAISPRDHLIGIYSSALVKDESCLQIGIGTLSNALANALIMRHKQNAEYLELLDHLEIKAKFGAIVNEVGEDGTFKEGLYASTEMMSDEYLNLYHAGILKKRVYDHVGLQRLINNKIITAKITPDILDVLLDQAIIQQQLTLQDVEFLFHFGIIKSDIKYADNTFILPDGTHIATDLSLPANKMQIIANCLGKTLQSGFIAHAGFFIGSVDFYQQLLAMPKAEAQLFNMTSITRTNALTWAPELLTLQRQNARLINSAMMVTLSGAIVSDGLKDIQEVSGVGGQFDFVNMAQNLQNARAIINCRSVRETKHGLESNIVWEYPNITIPRYLRDIVVTEYGIADCRSKTDSEIIKALLNITDSKFQATLLAQAKKAGKIAADYEIPPLFRENHYEKIVTLIKELQAKGFCKPYPFGSDLTADEIILQSALLNLKDVKPGKLFWLIIAAVFSFRDTKKTQPYIERMGLEKPKTVREFIYKRLLQYVLSN